MKSSPFVSVILPVYNAEKYLQKAIVSILKQTFTNFELLLLNDGSTDDSMKIINSFNDTRINIVDSKINKGIIYQLNLGISLAKGEYIARMDADDIAISERLEKQVQFFEKNPHIGVCGTYATVISETGEEINQWQMPTSHNDIKAGLLEGAVLCHPSVMFRAVIIKNHVFFYSNDWPHIEDYELWTRMIHHTQFQIIPEFLLQYRQHSHQVSMSRNTIQAKAMEDLRQLQITKITKNTLLDFHTLLHFLEGKWQQINIPTLKKTWTKFSFLATEQGYDNISLQKILCKRLFYYLADNTENSVHIKCQLMIHFSLIFRCWNIRKFLKFIRK